MSSSNPPSHSLARFSVSESRPDENGYVQIWVDDSDFGFDAAMRVTGDFVTPDEKRRYAQAVCDALNRAPLTIPREPLEKARG